MKQLYVFKVFVQLLMQGYYLFDIRLIKKSSPCLSLQVLSNRSNGILRNIVLIFARSC